MFHSSLHNATKGKRVVIILDGLDELPKSNLLWLPRELPDHVRIVLTALTNGGYYNGLKVREELNLTEPSEEMILGLVIN